MGVTRYEEFMWEALWDIERRRIVFVVVKKYNSIAVAKVPWGSGNELFYSRNWRV